MMTDVCVCFLVCIIERLRQASMRSQATQTEGYYNSTTSLSYPSCYSGAGSVTDRYKPPYLSSAASILNFFFFSFDSKCQFRGPPAPSHVKFKPILNRVNKRNGSRGAHRPSIRTQKRKESPPPSRRRRNSSRSSACRTS